MPIRIIGMIGVTPPASDTQLIVIEGALVARLCDSISPRPTRPPALTQPLSAIPHLQLKASSLQRTRAPTPTGSLISSPTVRASSPRP